MRFCLRTILLAQSGQKSWRRALGWVPRTRHVRGGSGGDGGRISVWKAASLEAAPVKEALLSAGLSCALVCPASGLATLLSAGRSGGRFAAG